MNNEKIKELLKKVIEIKRLSFMFCEHDSDEVSSMAQQINVLAQKSEKILERSTTEAL